LRRTMLAGRWALESYHDRIRQIVLRLISAEHLRVLHRRIAEALTARSNTDPEILVEHYLGAGDRVEAAQHAIVGGRHAAARLAFERAAELFDLAVKLRDDKEEDWKLLEEQAQALANAGRTNESAQIYLKAAANAEKLNCEAIKISAIKVRAAEQFLTGGFLARGSSLLRGVFDDLKLAFPTGPASAHLVSLKNRGTFLCRMWLRRQGGNLFRVLRPSGNTPPLVLLRLDTLWVASRSMTMLDYLVGEAMSSWYLTEAARQNDPSRLLRALCIEASIYANIGRQWSWRRSASFLHQAEELLRESKDPYDQAFLELSRTIIAWCRGDWRSCVDLASSTVAHLRSKCAGVNWDVAIALGFGVSGQVFLGELRELAQTTPELVSDAERRGDRYTATVFKSGYLVFLPLAEDRPEDALAAAELTIEGVPSDRFTSLHFHHFNAATNALLYSGRVWDAWALVERRWPLIKSAGLIHLGCIGTLLRETRARVALAAARDTPPKEFRSWTKSSLLSLALKEANAIAVKRFLPHADAMASGIRAGAANVEGDQSCERDALLSAVSGFEKAHMNLYRAAAQLCLGELLGGCEGGELIQTSEAFFKSQGVKKPDAMAALLFPGVRLH
jgi:tetratricopeptide (TPR) repeat protein